MSITKRYEFRFSGEGGQGVILGGAILAEAAILHEGKYAVQSPQYGSRVRGGPTKVDVIISEAPILYPRATKINFFLALAQMSYNKYATGLADDAVLLVDANLVPNVQDNGHVVYRLPIVEIGDLLYRGRSALQRALSDLPAPARQVIQLYDLEERPIDEVARVLGCSPGAVYVRRGRIHRRLRELLGPTTGFFTDAV